MAPPPRRPLPWWALPGLALIGVGAWLLARDVPAWNVAWYLFAWYGWLLLLDAAIHALGGLSFVAGRRRELAAMMLWSIPFWYLFEAYNLVLDNWYYVFILHDDRVQLAISWLAFATVLPACFLHAELVRGLGWVEGVRWPPLRVTPRLQAVLVALGAASILLPLLAPRWAFPLVWGAALWIPALLGRRLGAPSLLRDLEAGEPARLLRLLAGGMLAGLVWEGLNFWARCKWIYTVPFFDRLKLFEMPLLGFFGFPLLAVAAFESYFLLSWALRGGRHWEGPSTPRRPAPPRWLYAAALGTALLASVGVYRLVLGETVASRRPLLSELAGIDRAAAARLRGGGIATPERLLAAVGERGLGDVAAAAGLPEGRLALATAQARLALHKGMGSAAAARLLAVGVESPADLAAADPAALHRRLMAATPAGAEPPRLAEVKVWVRAAEPGAGPRR